ncbi:MAG: hypothetical protein NC920_02350 [Candidatus Omnitrophica bacterium]|nr:hypothetical protein [Candidatus Omnitrophota bacterium]
MIIQSKEKRRYLRNFLFLFLGSYFFVNSIEARERIRILYFFSPKCHACQKVKEKVLPPLLSKYKDKIEMVFYDINEPQNFNFLLQLEEKFRISEHGTIPKIFIGQTVLIGVTQIEQHLEELILQALRQKKIFKQDVSQENDFFPRLVKLFKTFTPGTVLSAGLIDGINPCAFTTLIFFLSFLTFAGYNKKQVVYLGSFFILAVFLTYFLLGLGVFKFILKLKFYGLLAEIFYYLVGVLVLVLAFLNFYDFYRFKKTKNIEEIKLKLPGIIKWRIQEVIGKGYRKEKGELSPRLFNLVFLSLVIGFIVSILESVCTGQVYLPTITFITRVQELRKKAIVFLLFYNLMFILPLLLIFLLVLYGLTSERFAKFAQRHIGKIKLVTALFFLGLFFLLWKMR